ncbi:fused response regulator/phosphatase [Maritimibacter sp. 55A14]|nr:fused response regulator/phosphatase [Maritimibacter sp. 55A14]
MRRILVADDSRMQRKILTASLRRNGVEVLEAETGDAALAICRETPVDLVLSDWMMPGMDGVEFCRAFRALGSDRYGYFILLTSKSGKDAIAQGLDAGADDFLTKPVNADELHARIRAGARILQMQRELVEKNRIVSDALAEIRTLYDALDRDLTAAKKLQESLVPEVFHDLGNARISLMLRSSGHVGGDLVGHFPIDGWRVGLYALDVSGHGVTSAMMTARLAGLLSGAVPEQNVALRRRADGGYAARPPEEVAARLNAQFMAEMDTDHYFTLLLAVFEVPTGRLTVVQAGHPHPALQAIGGEMSYLGHGGLPIGLIPDARFESFTLQLAPGERLLIYSDGVTECPDGEGGMIGEAGLARLMRRHHGLSGRAFLKIVSGELQAIAGTDDLPDDLSALLLEFDGPVAS